MKIIVCVKQVPAINEVRMDPVTNTIIRDGIEAVLNPFDAYAVEEALRLRERYGAELISLSMGLPAACAILKETVSLGFDKGYLLTDRAFAGADTLATAYALKCGIDKIGRPELIICGKMATDGDTAQVGPMLAEMLGMAHITDISKIYSLQNQRISCRKFTDDGYVDASVDLPAVLTVSKEINVPRLPSLSGMLRGHAAEIIILNSRDVAAEEEKIGLSGSPTQVVQTFIPNLSRHCEWLKGSSAEKVDGLLEVLKKHHPSEDQQLTQEVE